MHTQIASNLQAYVDDIFVKSARGFDLLADLAKTFANLRRYNIKLNPNKCVFCVPAGMLLGLLVHARGIGANAQKISAIINLAKPRELPHVKRQTRCLASLGRFISRLSGKAVPLY